MPVLIKTIRAGRKSLAFQIVLSPLLLTSGVSKLCFEHCVYNKKTILDFSKKNFLSTLIRMGAEKEAGRRYKY
jgi:hypothetical protein